MEDLRVKLDVIFDRYVKEVKDIYEPVSQLVAEASKANHRDYKVMRSKIG